MSLIKYNDYDFADILDRPDLVWSPYIAALDIRYCNFMPYLWCFTFDSTGIIIYGRTFDDLSDFFKIMANKMQFTPDHKLMIMVDNLSSFFGNTKKIFNYSEQPVIAKSRGEHLLNEIDNCYQFHCYTQYWEHNIDDDLVINGIVVPDSVQDDVSAVCNLLPEELDYCANRCLVMAAVMRHELDLYYQGNVASLPITKTARVKRLIDHAMRQQSNDCKCNLKNQIMSINPITSERGRNYVLPMLSKAFFGGISFAEADTIDRSFDNAYNADLSSAYGAAIFLNKFPMGKFSEMPIVSASDIINGCYDNYALLITCELSEIRLKKNALPFLPAALKNRYNRFSDDSKVATTIQETETGARIRSAKNLIVVLTDIDFKLLIQNYDILGNGIRIISIDGARYGYLPDYIMDVVVKLYSAKREAKNKKIALKKLGKYSILDKREYDNIKSEFARLYGIFTQSPYVTIYCYDPDTKDIQDYDDILARKNKKIDNGTIVKINGSKFYKTAGGYLPVDKIHSPVVYQWGVWTTAIVRREIAMLRRVFIKSEGIRVLSGDTDCINFIGDATHIISSYNDYVKDLISERCQMLGVDPAIMADLGSLTVTPYKKYKLTGLKQYCYISETENGDKFEYVVGGMNKQCKYFDHYFKTAQQKFDHFGLGLEIPAKWGARKINACIDDPITVSFTDRDGNRISQRVLSHMETINKKFRIYPVLKIDRLNNVTPINTDTLKILTKKIATSMNTYFNPQEFISGGIKNE